MSRIGKLPITVPAGVEVKVDENNTVTVKGPKGTLTQEVNPAIILKQEGNILTLERPSDAKPHKAMHGLYRSHHCGQGHQQATGWQSCRRYPRHP